MKKALFQLIIFLLLATSLYFALLQINWVSKIPLNELPSIDQTQLDDFLWNQMQLQLNLIPDSDSTTIIARKLLTQLSVANEWNDSVYYLHIDRNKVVNAFAYPGNHIVVNTGLIEFCKTEGELLSVIAHETAHLNKNHPMTLLKREVGVALLSSVIFGKNNSKVLTEISKTLTLTAYQREEESTADRLGLQYLIKAKMDPKDFINIQKELAKKENDLTKSLEWVSTHPDWQQRIEDLEVLLKSQPPITYKPQNILSPQEWSLLHKKSSSN